jgi:hypothetical protein
MLAVPVNNKTVKCSLTDWHGTAGTICWRAAATLHDAAAAPLLGLRGNHTVASLELSCSGRGQCANSKWETGGTPPPSHAAACESTLPLTAWCRPHPPESRIACSICTT